MEIPVSVLMWIMAALPIIVLMLLMIKFQWGAAEAAPIGLFISMVVGITLYKADIPLIAMESAKGIWSALVVLIVVWPAILIFEVASEAKAFSVFRVGMQKLTPNELLQVIILSWVFISFLQGITGFGVPVAVGAPLLVGIGMSPMWAVIIPLIGHAWGNTFGTLAVAWDSLVLQTNLSENPEMLLRTAMWAAIFIWIWNLITGISICWFYGGVRALKKGLPAVLIVSLIHGGGQLLLSQINQTLACFVPACIALVVCLLLGRTRLYREPWRIEDSKIMNRAVTGTASAEEDYPKDMSMHQAFLPYYTLTAITLIILLIKPIKNFLGQFTLGFGFPEMSTGYGYVNAAVEKFSPFAPLTHAGVFLLVSAGIGFAFFRKHNWIAKGQGKAVLRRSVEKTIPSAIAVVGFIIMSRVMGGTGQTVVLAEGIAAVLGKGYAVLAPVVGMLGSFMTSSNMASNILFGEFQLTTASILNFDPAAILGAQTAGGAIGNTICPGNIILGTTTAGILGKEGIVLKKILPITVTAAVIVGAILFIALVVV